MAVQLPDYLTINRGGVPQDGSSGEYYVETVQNLTHRVLQRIDVIGRFQLNTNNRWNGFNTTLSIANGNFNNNAGTGAEPTVDWRDVGPLLFDGYIIKNVTLAGRTNNNQVTDVDFRLYHQTGDFSTTWGSNAETTRTEIINQDSIGFTNNDQKLIRFSDINQTIVNDGFILAYTRPQGTITANRFLTVSMIIEYELGL